MSDEWLQGKSTFYVWFEIKKFGGGLKFFLYPPEKFLVCWGGLKTESGKFHEILTSVWGVLKLFYTNPLEKLLVCVEGSKLFITPPKLLVCWGGLKTESAKFHEILTSVWGV